MNGTFKLLSLLAMMAAVAGCGPAGPQTHAVKGSITLDGGEVSQLAGHSVEAVLETDPAVRASGVIQKDGSFKLVSLLEGQMREGAPPGKYNARIILSDDPDENGKKPAKPPLPRRFYRVDTSGLSFAVPEAGEVRLALSVRGK